VRFVARRFHPRGDFLIEWQYQQLVTAIPTIDRICQPLVKLAIGAYTWTTRLLPKATHLCFLGLFRFLTCLRIAFTFSGFLRLFIFFAFGLALADLLPFRFEP
jgi:hypothetical protein